MVGLRPQDPSPFWNPAMAKAKGMQSFMDANTLAVGHDYPVAPLPEFDYAAKADAARNSAARSNYRSSLNSLGNAGRMGVGTSGGAENATDRFGGATPDNQFPNDNSPNIPGSTSGGSGGGRLGAVLKALAQVESSGNWRAVNASSGALGRWQVMPDNLNGPSGWDIRSGVGDITPLEFLQRNALQKAIVRNIFGGYLRQYGLRGALSAWNAGPDDYNAWRSPGGVHDYVMRVLSYM